MASSIDYTIHILWWGIGSQRRHTYDPDFAAMQEFISGYDPVAKSK